MAVVLSPFRVEDSPVFLTVEEKREMSYSKSGCPDANQIWQASLGILREQVASAVYFCCLSESRGLQFESDVLTIEARTPYSREWLEHRLLDGIEMAAAEVVGRPVKLRFLLTNGSDPCPSPNGK